MTDAVSGYDDDAMRIGSLRIGTRPRWFKRPLWRRLRLVLLGSLFR
jgi:hypothetical protein